MVLPLLRENLSPERQLEVIGELLVDHEADDQRWVLDWISQDLTPNENKSLFELADPILQPQLVA